MNWSLNNNNKIKSANGSDWLQPFTQAHAENTTQRMHQPISNPQNQQRKLLSKLQIIEIVFLCFILIENIFIFVLAHRKKSPKKQSLFDTK